MHTQVEVCDFRDLKSLINDIYYTIIEMDLYGTVEIIFMVIKNGLVMEENTFV